MHRLGSVLNTRSRFANKDGGGTTTDSKEPRYFDRSGSTPPPHRARSNSVNDSRPESTGNRRTSAQRSGFVSKFHTQCPARPPNPECTKEALRVTGTKKPLHEKPMSRSSQIRCKIYQSRLHESPLPVVEKPTVTLSLEQVTSIVDMVKSTGKYGTMHVVDGGGDYNVKINTKTTYTTVTQMNPPITYYLKNDQTEFFILAGDKLKLLENTMNKGEFAKVMCTTDRFIFLARNLRTMQRAHTPQDLEKLFSKPPLLEIKDSFVLNVIVEHIEDSRNGHDLEIAVAPNMGENLSKYSEQLDMTNFMDLLFALKTLHESGYSHGDISQDNIVVKIENGVPVLCFIDLDTFSSKEKSVKGVSRLDYSTQELLDLYNDSFYVPGSRQTSEIFSSPPSSPADIPRLFTFVSTAETAIPYGDCRQVMDEYAMLRTIITTINKDNPELLNIIRSGAVSGEIEQFIAHNFEPEYQRHIRQLLEDPVEYYNSYHRDNESRPLLFAMVKK